MIGRVAAGVALAAGACVAYGVFVERRWYTLRRVTIPALPPGQRPLRVLHISDLHLTGDQPDKVEWVRRLAGLRPDLVVDTGDNLGGEDGLSAVGQALEPLLGVPGVFVFGSNDFHGPRPINPLAYFSSRRREHVPRGTLPTGELRDLLASGGWQDVEGARVRVDLDGRAVDIRGTSDVHMGDADYGRVAGPVEADADLTIGVTHSPYREVLDPMTADGVDLILAGHTHGGQVRVPGYGALVSNCDLEPSRARGVSLHTAGGRTVPLHVSAGLGTSRYAPFRFSCRPEATLLTLVARDAEAR